MRRTSVGLISISISILAGSSGCFYITGVHADAGESGSETVGDGDGDPTVGDGDGDPTTTGDGDGDGDGMPGDGDGVPGDGDGVPGDGDGMPGGDVPNGGACMTNAECQSGSCYVFPFLGGQCGECNADADCADSTGGGCSAPNPFDPEGSLCNMGGMGAGCQSNAVCVMGLSCGVVFTLGDQFELQTCGQCTTGADCPMSQLCAPLFSISNLAGANFCVDFNSLPQDAYCRLLGNGDNACETGICSAVDIMGLVQIGACGQCDSDADCGMGGQCQPGHLALDTGVLTGSVCM